MEVAPGVFLIERVIGNAYIIAETDGLTLIDTGLPGSAGKILRHISISGRQPTELGRILITHADPDHVGSLEDLRQKTSAIVFASQGEAECIRMGKSPRELKVKGIRRLLVRVIQTIFPTKPAQVDAILAPGQELPILGGLQVISTPGHTPDHISLWSPSTGVLFSGDSIVVHHGTLSPSRGMNNWNLELSQASLKKQADLHPKYVLGGHGWTANITDASFGDMLSNGA